MYHKKAELLIRFDYFLISTAEIVSSRIALGNRTNFISNFYLNNYEHK